MYLMILKLEILTLSFSRKNAFLLAAGVRNLKSYESARFARSTSRERNMFRFKEKRNALVSNKSYLGTCITENLKALLQEIRVKLTIFGEKIITPIVKF